MWVNESKGENQSEERDAIRNAGSTSIYEQRMRKENLRHELEEMQKDIR